MAKEEPARQEGGEQCPGEIVKKILGSWSQGERELEQEKVGSNEAGAGAGSAGPCELGSWCWSEGEGSGDKGRVLFITIF